MTNAGTRVSQSNSFSAVHTRCLLCDREIVEYVYWRKRVRTLREAPEGHRKRVVCAPCFAREWNALRTLARKEGEKAI